jgi:threonine dehydratase
MSALAISFADIVAAHERITNVAHRTPILTSKTADALVGAKLYFKCENFQRMGAFKFRGAYNALTQFTPEQRSTGVIAYSSGNHAQAVALSAHLLRFKAVILMPDDAPAVKVQATRGYGAEVVHYNRYTQDREELGRKLAEDRQLTLIPPYDHPQVMAGQGTAIKELFEDAGPMDVLVVPLGGGGLLSGSAVAARELSPRCRVIGVEPAAGDDGRRSLRTGTLVRIDTPRTIADGAQTQHLGRHTFPIIQQLVDDIVTVSDSELVDAMAYFAARMKMVVEPTGCLAAAALLTHKISVAGEKVGIVVSGGNVDLLLYAELLQTANC